MFCLFSASTRRKRRASSAYRCAIPLRPFPLRPFPLKPFPLRPFPLGQRRGAHHPHIGVRSCDRTCGRKPTDLSNRPIAVATNSSDRRGDRMLVVLLLHKTRFAGICVSAHVHGRVCHTARECAAARAATRTWQVHRPERIEIWDNGSGMSVDRIHEWGILGHHRGRSVPRC